ncbi:hypothetical protein NHQ30_006263 [Ciborinia camelliae]|nr:hypothetical protein NHQ30_006263 [Ciborinia camelliae]
MSLPFENSSGEIPASNAPFHTPQTASTHSISRQGKAKMFHPLPAKIYQIVSDQWEISHARAEEYQDVEMANRYRSRAWCLPLPELKTISMTPLPSKSNVGTGIILDDDTTFHSWSPSNGILSTTTNGMVEFICDYANRWHSALPSRDPNKPTPNRHLPGTVPMFAYLPSGFWETMVQGYEHAATELAKKLSREAFWQLRYLFIIIQTDASDDPYSPIGHVAVCAISPEAKTIDYLCSSGDDGLIRGGGAECVESLIALLTEYLGDQPPLAQRFNPCDWKLRTGRSGLQDPGSPDCGLFTVSNIMCLAFGWDLDYSPRGRHEMASRRTRLVADLQFGGFKGYDPDPNADNTHYYPLNDVRPANSLTENFIPILSYPGLMICETLTSGVRGRLPMYYGCPDKEALYEHCGRNRRFYPNFHADEISGPTISFAKFLSWVEMYDAAREKNVSPFPKRYLSNGVNGNRIWIHPTQTGQLGKLW